MLRRCLKACLRHRVLRPLIALALITGFFCLVILFLILGVFETKALKYDMGAVSRVPMRTSVLDATGTPIGNLHGSKGSNLQLNEITRYFLDALIAREDARFWKHHGVDHIGLMRANLRNIRDKEMTQGASTITMQLARMTFEQREKELSRKILEMAISRRIERHFPKEEILRLYVNRIYLGTEMHGIQQAADGYFGKHPAQLTLSEAAMLAGIIRAPNGVSPFRQYPAALREMRTTLDRMVIEEMITAKEAEAAKQIQPRVLPQSRWMKKLQQRRAPFRKNWFLAMIHSQIEDLIPGAKSYGGLTVSCTIDHRIQNATDRAVQEWLAGIERAPAYEHPVYPAKNAKGEPIYLQGAGVVIDNLDGSIRALTGGRNYAQSQFNRAIHANRQAGSIIKPLVYAAAFETGMLPGFNISDEVIGSQEFKWWPDTWSPTNSDGVHRGKRPAEQGLVRSRNTMTVRVGETAGIDTVNTMFQHAGIAADGGPRDPQVFIGNLPVSLLSMTSAYSAFPMKGQRFQPYLIQSIVDRHGQEVFRHKPRRYQLFSPEAAWMTSSILEKVLKQGGTGANLRRQGFSAPAGGKTGTTNDFVDAWFVGYTSRLTSGFWVGLDQPKPMVAGAYGGIVAMPMWRDTIAEAVKIGYPAKSFQTPPDMFQVRLCRNSGLLASPGCDRHGCAYTETVPSAMIPRKFCQLEAE